MDDLSTLDRKLKKAGKLESIMLSRQILELRFKDKDPEIMQSFDKALGIVKECLEFDPQPPKDLCDNIAGIFFFVFQAMRFYLGGRSFSRVFQEFSHLETFLSTSDFLPQVYADLSYIFWLKHDLNSSLQYGKKSLEYADKLCDEKLLPGRYTNIGFIYEEQGDYSNAEKYYNKGMIWGLQHNSANMICLAYCGFGRLNLKKSNFKTAIHFFLEALKYFDDDKCDDYISVCSNLGIAYGRIGDYSESLKYFERFITNETRQKNADIYYSLLLNAAHSYMYEGSYNKAEKYLSEVHEFGERVKSSNLIAAALINLGKLASIQNNWEKSIQYYLKSKQYLVMSENMIEDIASDIGLGDNYLCISKNDKAKRYLSNAYEKAHKLELKNEIRHCVEKLAIIHEDEGDYVKALSFYKLFKDYELQIKDEQYNLDLRSIKESCIKDTRYSNTTIFIYDHSLISKELSALVKGPLIGYTRAMQGVVSRALVAAETNYAPVLLTGESGTGKEIIARIIHYQSSRKKSPFITVNSVAFSSSLVESAFFGSEKGAYTGSIDRKTGYFEAVQKGTLFLDEIGDMSLPMQAKLLRVLEEHVIHRIGSTKDISLDFRLISATNRDLYQKTEQNCFRFDLLNRINTLEIFIPPLRERKEDIPLLTDYFITIFSQQKDSTKPIIAKESLELLLNYQYPGNVRELRNILQRSILLCNKSVLEPEDIVFGNPSSQQFISPNNSIVSYDLAECERITIGRAMQKANNVQAKAAELLGISPYSLSRKLKKIRNKNTHVSHVNV